MNANDESRYMLLVMNVLRTRNDNVLAILRNVYSSSLRSSRNRAIAANACRAFDNGLISLQNIVAGVGGVGGQSITKKMKVIVNGVTTSQVVAGDIGDASEQTITDKLIDPVLRLLFPNLGNTLNTHGITLSQLRHNNYVFDGLLVGRENKLVLENKKLGYFRKSVSLRTAKDVRNYIGQLNGPNAVGRNPLTNINDSEYLVGGLAKQATSYVENNKHLTKSEGFYLLSCGATYSFGISVVDYLSDLEKYQLTSKYGFVFDPDDLYTGAYSYLNIPFFSFSMFDNDVEDYLILLMCLVKSYLSRDKKWLEFKTLYHQWFITNL